MANTNAPFGFRYVRRLDGAPPNYGTMVRLAPYTLAASYTGDVFASQTTGYVGLATAGTAPIAGIAQEFQWYSSSQNALVTSKYYPGSDTTGDISVTLVIDPQAVFQAQAGPGSGSTPIITFADIGANINFNAGSGGNAYTGQSGEYLDQNTINPATTTLPFRIVGIVPAPNSDPTSNYNIAEVAFNYQDFRINLGT